MDYKEQLKFYKDNFSDNKEWVTTGEKIHRDKVSESGVFVKGMHTFRTSDRHFFQTGVIGFITKKDINNCFRAFNYSTIINNGCYDTWPCRITSEGFLLAGNASANKGDFLYLIKSMENPIEESGDYLEFEDERYRFHTIEKLISVKGIKHE